MKPLLDYFPIVAFLVVYNLVDIYAATGVLILSSLLQIVILWLWKREFEKMHVITFVLVAVFGGLTIALKDENFIKWKVTVIYWIFAGFFIVSSILKKNPLKSFLGKDLPLPDPIWNKIVLWCTVYFVALGFLNIYIAYNFSLDFWVNFKVFGLTAMTFVFTLAIGIVIYPYLEQEEAKQEEAKKAQADKDSEKEQIETINKQDQVID